MKIWVRRLLSVPNLKEERKKQLQRYFKLRHISFKKKEAKTIDRFGQFLVNNRVVDEAAILEALNIQKKRSIAIGQIALREKMLSIHWVFEILNAQIGTDKLFGKIAIEKGYLKTKEVEKLLEIQKLNRPLIGEMLVEMKKITSDNHEILLKKFKKSSSENKRPQG